MWTLWSRRAAGRLASPVTDRLRPRTSATRASAAATAPATAPHLVHQAGAPGITDRTGITRITDITDNFREDEKASSC
jgi:hypothetical protein